jgi:hypothetical protein
MIQVLRLLARPLQPFNNSMLEIGFRSLLHEFVINPLKVEPFAKRKPPKSSKYWHASSLSSMGNQLNCTRLKKIEKLKFGGVAVHLRCGRIAVCADSALAGLGQAFTVFEIAGGARPRSCCRCTTIYYYVDTCT